ncbi:hypothetical protein K458DRAFT_301270 [Lentithecium fluviatile CBS 122367]|uniref:Chromatin assembly factor 1 subunit A n=1 Tax=Lentithecium fluviatile CBS 122367 TaxID=1168545 RepID=A0A6G1J4L4_9PLEO|nr:hypothetical protein K458DRAFT_301270 [Lentithecium fluviatile CBS 122367]
MEVSTPSALAVSQKRPHDDAEPSFSTPSRAISSTASTPLTVVSSMDTPSPLKQAATAIPLSSTTSAAGNAPTPAPAATAPNTTQSAKRRKLTPQEKKDREVEKEAKAKAIAEKKAQKELEEKAKAEQKAQKEEEKRKKNEEKEEKKRAREQKQQQEEEEKRKKERSQMRLNAFFTKPKPAGDTPSKAMVDTVQNPCTGSTSLAPDTPWTSTDPSPPSPQKAIQRNAQSDYERFFLPFSLPPHAVLAPSNAFMVDPDILAAAQKRMDLLAAQEDLPREPITLETVRSLFPKRRRGTKTATIAEIVDLVNGSADRPIDLTGDGSTKPPQPLQLLKQVPMKYLHFPEDVRPPYYGTYTKPHTSAEERTLARNPCSRGFQDLNYDYDSEAEWEEPEEGEDLDSDGDDDLDDEGDEEMDGFLDDDDDPQLKRRLLSGDQEPISTGLCWEDLHGVSRLNDGSRAISTEFKDFRMGFLLEPQPQSIDPFSTTYWAPEPIPAPVPVQPTIKDMATNGSMNPPRLPLAARPINGLLNTLNTLNTPQNVSPGSAAKAVKPKRMISPDQLQAFKAEVEGQDLTKIGMIEALKKKFPKVPKDAITNTLTAVAKRVGPSEKEKRWVLFN